MTSSYKIIFSPAPNPSSRLTAIILFPAPRRICAKKPSNSANIAEIGHLRRKRVPPIISEGDYYQS